MNRLARPSRLLGIMGLLLNLLAPLSPHPVTAQLDSPATAPIAPRFQLGAPVAIPSVDARPLLDEYRAQHNEKLLAPPSQVKNLSVSQTQAPLAPVVGGGMSAPDSTAAVSALSGLVGKPLGEIPATIITPQVSVASCSAPLYNSSLDYGTGWYSYADTVYLSSAAYNTPPHSIRMVEDNDGVVGSNFYDQDAFGQTFYFPSTVNSFIVDYKVAYALGSTSGGDKVYFGLYQVNSSGTLIEEIAFAEVPKYSDNQWHSVSDVTGYQSFFQYLQGYQLALVFYTVTDGLNPKIDVYLDDIVMTMCTGTTPPTGTLSGQVTQTGVTGALSDTLLLLTYKPAGGSLQLVDLTFPAPNGAYSFNNLDTVTTGDYYSIWYLNDGLNSNRMSLWLKSPINSVSQSNINFDIKDVTLTNPAHEAEATFPVTFQWASRQPGDTYYLCIYNMDDLSEACTTQAISSTSLTVNATDLQGVSGFTFGYGRRYGWYLLVSGANSSGAGFSYSARAVTFVTTSSSKLNPQVTPSGPSPTNTTTTKDWTVMIYIAGDNNLGDPERYTDPSHNLQGQFASLKQLAASYPNINLVTLTDFYDNSGTELCHIKSDGPPNCQQLGEKDTSNPATLTSFIITATTNFPATRKMLIIADHGHGLNGLAADETTSRTAQMTPDGLRQALQNANLAGNKLDVLFYNACLLGNFEAVYDASSFANYLVASANEVWVINIYTRLLPLLTSGTTTKDVASGIVNAYRQTVDALAPGYFVSSAAYDLSRVSAVNSALSALATAISNDLAFSRSAIATVRSQVQLYDSSGDSKIGTEDAFVDVRDLATRLQGSTATNAIKTAAGTVLTQLGTVGGASSLVIASQQVTGRNGAGGTDNLANASGLSLYFPNGEHTGQQPTYTNIYLNKNTYLTYNNTTQWDEFVRGYVSGAATGGPTSIQSGARPVSGALPQSQSLYLPLIRR